VTTGSGVLLVAVMLGLVVVRPGLFRALEDGPVVTPAAGSAAVPGGGTVGVVPDPPPRVTAR
jgi:hypothetical protein